MWPGSCRLLPLVAVLAILGAGCNGCRGPAIRHTGETVVDAMLAVHGHALVRDPRTREALGLLPIERAAAILQADDSPGGRSRQRRAIARLAAYRFDGKGFDGRTVAALEALRVDVDALTGALVGLVGAPAASTAGRPGPGVHPVAMFERVQAGGGGAHTVMELEREIADLPDLDARTPSCKWERLEQWVTPINDTPPQPPSVWATVRIRVPRPLNDVAAAVDPQNLDECGKFFCPATPAPGRVYRARKTLWGFEDLPPLPAGQPYPAPQVIFEDFRCPPGSACTTRVRNLLEVYTWHGSSTAPTGIGVPGARTARPSYRVSYSLKEALSARLTEDGSPVHLEIDGGELIAEADGAEPDQWTVVYGEKHVRYHEDVAQMAVHVALLRAELMGELAEVACCPTPAPTACNGP